MSHVVASVGILGGGGGFKVCALGSGSSMAGGWENGGILLSELVGG